MFKSWLFFRWRIKHIVIVLCFFPVSSFLLDGLLLAVVYLLIAGLLEK